MRALLAWSALLTLAACQSLPLIPATAWPVRRAALQGIESYAFNGQLAAATASEGFSASLRWRQQGAASDLLLRAPFGVGGAHVRFDGELLGVSASDGSELQGAAARSELVRLLGFEPPLSSLRYWLLGVPDPATPGAIEAFDAAQRLSQLRQDGWQVDYSEYLRSAGQWLPRRLVLQRGALKLKLRVSNWQLP